MSLGAPRHLPLERHGIIWHYSAGDNPKYGGAFERMVGGFKRAFGGITNKADLSLEAFHTYAVVVEGIVNARPLLPVPSETRDLHRTSYLLVPRSRRP